MPTPKMTMWWVVVVPARGVWVSTWSSTQITADFYYTIPSGGVASQIINNEWQWTWSSTWVKVNHIDRIATAKLKWGNEQKLKPRSVVGVWQIGRWTFFGIHSDWTYMSTITWTASDSYVSAWTITPKNYVWYLTINFWDKTYIVPYYSPTQ